MEEEVRRSPEARRLRKQSFFWGLGANLEGLATCLLLLAMLVGTVIFWSKRLEPEMAAPKQASSAFVTEEFKGLVLPNSTGLEVKLYRPEVQFWWFFYTPPSGSAASLAALSDHARNNEWTLTAKKESEMEFARSFDSHKKYISLIRWRRSSKNLEIFVTTARLYVPSSERWKQVNVSVGIDRFKRAGR